MVVLVVLLVSLVLFGGLGALGVGALSTWHEVVAWALATMFLFTASSHFVARTREDLIAMVPGVFPRPALLVSLTGFLEGLGAVGLMIPATRGWRVSAWYSCWWRCYRPTSVQQGGACRCVGGRQPRYL